MGYSFPERDVRAEPFDQLPKNVGNVTEMDILRRAFLSVVNDEYYAEYREEILQDLDAYLYKLVLADRAVRDGESILERGEDYIVKWIESIFPVFINNIESDRIAFQRSVSDLLTDEDYPNTFVKALKTGFYDEIESIRREANKSDSHRILENDVRFFLESADRRRFVSDYVALRYMLWVEGIEYFKTD